MGYLKVSVASCTIEFIQYFVTMLDCVEYITMLDCVEYIATIFLSSQLGST